MRALVPVLFLILTCPAFAAETVVNFAAPAVLPGVQAEMLTAGYWTARHPAPDEAVMTESAVRAFDRRLADEGFVEDFSRAPEMLAGPKVVSMISEITDGLKKREFFRVDGKKAAAGFVTAFDREVDAVPAHVEVKYGFVVRATSERLLPTDEPLYETPGDIDFDQLQNSGLMPGDPVLILHRSFDHKWFFVRDRIASGWVPVGAVALAAPDQFADRAVIARPVVVVSPKADVFLDKAMTEHFGAVRMGTAFLYKAVWADVWEVTVPAKGEDGRVKFVPAFIAKDDAIAGYLPFTPRNVYRQAFKLLYAPYGWGDMNGGQDCSRFLQMVYATVGVTLPRNSGEQGRIGQMVPGFDPGLPQDSRQEVIVDKAPGAATILRLQGHIMMYLGVINGVPYAIHATWAYRDKDAGGQDRARVIGRVTVSTLDLGAGSKKGSLLERIISARILR